MRRCLTSRTGASQGYGLMLIALLVVLVPSICLVWFMNRAVQNERLAVQQKLVEAYRGHLTLAQERLGKHLRDLASDLERATTDIKPAGGFSRAVRAGRARSEEHT